MISVDSIEESQNSIPLFGCKGGLGVDPRVEPEDDEGDLGARVTKESWEQGWRRRVRTRMTKEN